MSDEVHSFYRDRQPKPKTVAVEFSEDDLNTVGQLLDVEIGTRIKRIRESAHMQVPEFYLRLTTEDEQFAKALLIRLSE